MGLKFGAAAMYEEQPAAVLSLEVKTYADLAVSTSA